MGKYELVTPTIDIIEKYNDFWENSNKDWNVPLFKNMKDVDIRQYISADKFNIFKSSDDEIKEYWKKGKVDKFLNEINSVYHTRVKGLNGFTFEKREFEDMSLDDFIGRIWNKTKRYEYSFATKVFSFIYPKKYPIIDSLAATLLWKYLDSDNRKVFAKGGWGDYSEYKKAYDAFIKQYGLGQKTYKEIDKFLWTYAVAIQEYWKKELGVFTFESVPYKR